MQDLMHAIDFIKAAETLLNPVLEHIKEENRIKLFLSNAICHIENAVLLNNTRSTTLLENKVNLLEEALRLSEQKRANLVENIELFIKKIKEPDNANTNTTME